MPLQVRQDEEVLFTCYTRLKLAENFCGNFPQCPEPLPDYGNSILCKKSLAQVYSISSVCYILNLSIPSDFS